MKNPTCTKQQGIFERSTTLTGLMTIGQKREMVLPLRRPSMMLGTHSSSFTVLEKVDIFVAHIPQTIPSRWETYIS